LQPPTPKSNMDKIRCRIVFLINHRVAIVGQCVNSVSLQSGNLLDHEDAFVLNMPLRLAVCPRNFRQVSMSKKTLKIECADPTGAFYCFPDVSAHYGRSMYSTQIASSIDFSQVLLEQANVAVVPGVAFGCDNNVCLSFACSLEQINRGLDRLEQ